MPCKARSCVGISHSVAVKFVPYLYYTDMKKTMSTRWRVVNVEIQLIMPLRKKQECGCYFLFVHTNSPPCRQKWNEVIDLTGRENDDGMNTWREDVCDARTQRKNIRCRHEAQRPNPNQFAAMSAKVGMEELTLQGRIIVMAWMHQGRVILRWRHEE